MNRYFKRHRTVQLVGSFYNHRLLHGTKMKIKSNKRFCEENRVQKKLSVTQGTVLIIATDSQISVTSKNGKFVTLPAKKKKGIQEEKT